MALLLGYDVGSSSIKATLMDAETGKALGSATSPRREMEIIAKNSGWAEQHPDTWWENLKQATLEIKQSASFDPADIRAIGIAYQMHGLVAIDRTQHVLRPAIIWCDSRAVPYGDAAAEDIGREKCLSRLLNFPGNFTASKLQWVKENEPDIFAKIHKILLPGDYIAMRLTGEARTTNSGLSEGVLWDFQDDAVSDMVLESFGYPRSILADPAPTFSDQGHLTRQAADELGLAEDTPVAYRGGDQPNNALSLRVIEPGEIAVTAGTSGVVCGISDKKQYDPKSRVNTFLHVNHSRSAPRYCVLLCVAGTGILNSWLKHYCASVDGGGLSYEDMNTAAAQAPVGSKGLVILPYGNGSERTLENRDPGASIHCLNFNTHTRAHLLRAAQEGIVFALNYGLGIMKGVGIELKKARAGYANMFLSPLFAETFATLTGASVELYNTDGSLGAARGAGIGIGVYKSFDDAYVGLEPVKTVEPNESLWVACDDAYNKWLGVLKKTMECA